MNQKLLFLKGVPFTVYIFLCWLGVTIKGTVDEFLASIVLIYKYRYSGRFLVTIHLSEAEDHALSPASKSPSTETKYATIHYSLTGYRIKL